MAGDEADDVAELELSHEVENGAREHRAQRVRCDSCGDDRIGLVRSHRFRDGGGHVVEEGYNFDLSGVSNEGQSYKKEKKEKEGRDRKKEG